MKEDSSGCQVDSGTREGREDDREEGDVLEDDKEVEEEDDGWRRGEVDGWGGGDIRIDVVCVNRHIGQVAEGLNGVGEEETLNVR